MIFTQYYLDCLSQASYLVADEQSRQAVVVDPRRDVEEYLADAREQGLTIVGIINTEFNITLWPRGIDSGISIFKASRFLAFKGLAFVPAFLETCFVSRLITNAATDDRMWDMLFTHQEDDGRYDRHERDRRTLKRFLDL